MSLDPFEQFKHLAGDNDLDQKDKGRDAERSNSKECLMMYD